MLTWGEFASAQPELADRGRGQLYQWGIGLGFLATVRADGGPRVHPVCPVFVDGGVYVLVTAGPKRGDLRRDGRYSLHGETFAPPRHDDGFAISGAAREVKDPAVRQRFNAQMETERENFTPWPGFDEEVLFELLIERSLLMLTEAEAPFPKGPTVWLAESPDKLR